MAWHARAALTSAVDPENLLGGLSLAALGSCDDGQVARRVGRAANLAVAAVRGGAAGDSTEIWSSPDGGTWTHQQVGLGDPALTYAGDRFVLVGGFGRSPDWHYVAQLSPDGQSWTEMRPVFRASSTAEPELACIDFIGGGADGVLLGGPECGVWHADLP